MRDEQLACHDFDEDQTTKFVEVFCQTVIKSSRVQSPSLITAFRRRNVTKFKQLKLKKSMENFQSFSIIFNYYLPFYLLYVVKLELNEISRSRFYSIEYKAYQRYREIFQGRATKKKFNVKNIHFDKSKLEENKRNNTKKLGNFCVEPRHPTDSGL